MWVWDYNLPKNWHPKTNEEWEWFLVRKINYGDFTGIAKIAVIKYFPKVAPRLDPGKRAMIESFLQKWS